MWLEHIDEKEGYIFVHTLVPRTPLFFISPCLDLEPITSHLEAILTNFWGIDMNATPRKSAKQVVSLRVARNKTRKHVHLRLPLIESSHPTVGDKVR
jgi:hypothetical protein